MEWWRMCHTALSATIHGDDWDHAGVLAIATTKSTRQQLVRRVHYTLTRNARVEWSEILKGD